MERNYCIKPPSSCTNNIFSIYAFKARNGFSLIKFDNYLILFGGMLELTYETNDMYCFSLEKSDWIKIDDDSSRNNVSK